MTVQTPTGIARFDLDGILDTVHSFPVSGPSLSRVNRCGRIPKMSSRFSASPHFKQEEPGTQPA